MFAVSSVEVNLRDNNLLRRSESRRMKSECEIFVPGRLCLFGEHSDTQLSL